VSQMQCRQLHAPCKSIYMLACLLLLCMVRRC
jgi:hypothetical protein